MAKNLIYYCNVLERYSKLIGKFERYETILVFLSFHLSFISETDGGMGCLLPPETAFEGFEIIFFILPFLASILVLNCISISGRYGKKPYLLLYNVLERYSKLIGKLERFETIFVFFSCSGCLSVILRCNCISKKVIYLMARFVAHST